MGFLEGNKCYFTFLSFFKIIFLCRINNIFFIIIDKKIIKIYLKYCFIIRKILITNGKSSRNLSHTSKDIDHGRGLFCRSFAVGKKSANCFIIFFDKKLSIFLAGNTIDIILFLFIFLGGI